MGLSPKFEVADSEYLLNRAAVEASRADGARPELAAIHQEIASAYLDRVFGAGPLLGTRSASASSDDGEERLALAKTVFSQLAPIGSSQDSEALQAGFQSLLGRLA